MLLIAIPKSASTSIMSTIGKLHSIEAKQDTKIYRSLPKPKETRYLHNLHGDVREFNEQLINKWNDQNILFKQHIFPTKNNLKLLRKIPKVVLLRNPEEVVLAYHRGVESGIHKMPKGFKYGMSPRMWLKRSTDLGLLNDLEVFYNNWINTSDENTLLIDFDEFIQNKKAMINKIERFLHLEITENIIELQKKRYSSRQKTLKQKIRLWLKKRIVNLMIFFKLPY